MPNDHPIQSKRSIKTPFIVAFVSDLYFASRIESVVSRLGYKVAWIERLGMIYFRLTKDGKTIRRPIDSDTSLLDQITNVHPGLIIYELGTEDTPWRRWLHLLKISPETRRFPILCYGSHTDVETFRFARSIGVEAVIARSRFVTEMTELISRYLIVPDYASYESSCKEKLSDFALRGIEEFNRGEYFQAHESLECAWMEDTSTGRELYRGILQVAVAYYQVVRGNYKGAVKMFMRLRQWLEPLPELCRGVDVAQIRTDSDIVFNMVLEFGPEGINHIDRTRLKPVHYTLE